ncbi:MAG: hypothetical protein II825_07490 [Paludibacteraceae bacterium]|nr:hypothetical protein [Paludibacteraceae bacterium]
MTHNLNIGQIKSLLARFYEGKTTAEEEQILVDIFRREDIPEDLQQDKQLFLVLAQVSEQEMPSDIAEEITAFVYNLGQTKIQPHIYEDKQQKGVIFRLKTPPKDKEFNVPEVGTSVTRAPHLLRPQATGFRSVRLNRFLYRVAATMTLLLALGGGMWVHQRQISPFRDTCSTPEEAANAIFYANDIINRSAAPFLRSTMVATKQMNDINETLGKIQPYINQ